MAKKVAINVAGNAAGNVANQAISKGVKKISAKKAAVAGATGILDVAGNAAGTALKKAGSKAVRKIAGAAAEGAGAIAAKKAGAKAAQKALGTSAEAGLAGAGKNAVSSQQGLGKKLLDGIDNLKSTGKALLKDEGGFLDLDALAGKKSVSGAVGKSGSKTDVTTGLGYDAGDTPVRIDGDWTENDMKQALLGHPPRDLGSPDIHHGGQMPGGALHEVLPGQHRNNPALHPNTYNQGVTPEMRMEDRQLHWWYRAREQGADELLPDWIYD